MTLSTGVAFEKWREQYGDIYNVNIISDDIVCSKSPLIIRRLLIATIQGVYCRTRPCQGKHSGLIYYLTLIETSPPGHPCYTIWHVRKGCVIMSICDFHLHIALQGLYLSPSSIVFWALVYLTQMVLFSNHRSESLHRDWFLSQVKCGSPWSLSVWRSATDRLIY